MNVDYFKKYGDSSGGTLNDICEAYPLGNTQELHFSNFASTKAQDCFRRPLAR